MNTIYTCSYIISEIGASLFDFHVERLLYSTKHFIVLNPIKIKKNVTTIIIPYEIEKSDIFTITFPKDLLLGCTTENRSYPGNFHLYVKTQSRSGTKPHCDMNFIKNTTWDMN